MDKASLELENYENITPIKLLTRELKVYKKQIILVALLGLGVAAAAGRMTILVKPIFDDLSFANQNTIYRIGFEILILALLAATFRFFHIYQMNMIGERVALSLRLKLQSHFMKLSLQNSEHNSGALLTRIMADIGIIQAGLRLIADFFREPPFMLYLIGLLFWLDWKITAAVFIVLPLVLRLTQKIAVSVRKYSHQGQKSLEEITSHIKETLDGVRIIQAFNLQSEIYRRLKLEFQNFLNSLNEIQKNILLSMLKYLNRERVKKISSEEAKNYINKTFEEIQLAA